MFMAILPFRRSSGGYQYYQLTLYIIVINVGIFVLNLINDQVGPYLALNPILFQEGFYWQPLSYMFLHTEPMHLLFNMLALFFFSFEVERQMGSIPFLFFYLASGIGAGLLSFVSYILTGTMSVFLLGASGAIYAVLLAFACFNPYAKIYLFAIIPISAPWLVVGYAAVETVFAFVDKFGGGVAHLTHLFGLLIGYLWMLIRYRLDLIRILMHKD